MDFFHFSIRLNSLYRVCGFLQLLFLTPAGAHRGELYKSVGFTYPSTYNMLRLGGKIKRRWRTVNVKTLSFHPKGDHVLIMY